MEYGLLGERLGHSYSPKIHSLLGSYHYELHACDREALKALMESRDFLGLNVTIPYKKDVMPYCDLLTDTAREIGCVNTLVHRPDGTLLGHNTDIGGFMAMLRGARIDPADKKCCILGNGATSQTAAVALHRMGALEVILVARRGPITVEKLYAEHADVEIVVNCTPVGMYPNNGVSVVDLSMLPSVCGVVDVVYNPERTKLILDAEERGIPHVSGLPMLVAQAREAAEYFTGQNIDSSVDKEICAEIKRDTLNLILIGMPGSGKSSIAHLLSQMMRRPLVDCDSEIENKAGMTIPEIFEKHGEKFFRNLESEVTAEVCKHPGQIISTGGGVILRPENIRSMRQNGRLGLIRRSIDILPLDGRPLSSSQEAVKKLWEQRREKYLSAADFIIDNDTTIEKAVQAAMEGFNEAARH